MSTSTTTYSHGDYVEILTNAYDRVDGETFERQLGRVLDDGIYVQVSLPAYPDGKFFRRDEIQPISQAFGDRLTEVASEFPIGTEVEIHGNRGTVVPGIKAATVRRHGVAYEGAFGIDYNPTEDENWFVWVSVLVPGDHYPTPWGPHMLTKVDSPDEEIRQSIVALHDAADRFPVGTRVEHTILGREGEVVEVSNYTDKGYEVSRVSGSAFQTASDSGEVFVTVRYTADGRETFDMGSNVSALEIIAQPADDIRQAVVRLVEAVDEFGMADITEQSARFREIGEATLKLERLTR